MTILQIIGALMIVAFFVALFIFVAVIFRDWKVPTVVFGAVALMVAFIGLASALLTGTIS